MEEITYCWVHRTDGIIDMVAFQGPMEGFCEEMLDILDAEVQAFLNPPVLPPSPLDFPLSPDQFYTMLETEEKLDAFIAAIETVTPTAKKLTCRNQFNNATVFTWDMVLVTQVMPKAAIYGATWEETLAPIWIAAYETLPSTPEAA